MLEVTIRQARSTDIARCHQQRKGIVGFINSGATGKQDLSDEAFKAMVGHDDNGANIVIFSVAVDPAVQKNGIARQLLFRFYERATMLNKHAILLLCKSDLLGLYRKFGFIDLGKSASTHGGYSWHTMRRAI